MIATPTKNVNYVVNAVSFGQSEGDVDLLVAAAKHYVDTGEHMDGFDDLITVETLPGYNPDGSDRHIVNWK